MVDFDIFFSSPRWDILKIIAKAPSSPVKISEKINTTVSYVSQQLKLFEAADLVDKKRTGAAEKGKPRLLYSLKNELGYLVSLTKNFSQKNLIPLTEHHKTILRIWSVEDTSVHYIIEKIYWQLENNLEEIDFIVFDNSNLKPKIIFVSDSAKIKSKINSLFKSISKLTYQIISRKDFKSQKDYLYIYSNKKLKGGKNENGKKEK